MELNNDLITQFAKITKFNPTKSATTVRGTIRKSNDESDTRTYLQIDGAEEGSKTPVETVVEVADGDRVIATVKDHSVIVMGNKTNPAIGTFTAKGIQSEITQTADEIKFKVTEFDKSYGEFKVRADSVTTKVEEFDKSYGEFKVEANSVTTKVEEFDKSYAQFKVDANAVTTKVEEFDKSYAEFKVTAESVNSKVGDFDGDYTEFKQTVDKFEFITEDGVTRIDGSCISTTNLVLNGGSITWDHLNGDVTSGLNDTASSAANTAVNNATESMTTAANNAAASASQANISANNANDAASRAESDASDAKIAAENAENSAEDAADDAKVAKQAAEAAANSAALAAEKAGTIPDTITGTYIDESTIMSPTIIGGYFYAVGANPDDSKKKSFTKMDEDGFYLYHANDTPDHNGSIYPKICLRTTVDNFGNDHVQCILGAGAPDDSDTHNRFYIEKTSNAVYMNYLYEGSTKDDYVGLNFHSNGQMTIAAKQIVGVGGLFPIGYIYISTDTTNPASLFGGYWDRLGSYVLATTDTNSAVGTTGNVVIAGGTNTAYSFKVAAWERVG